MSKWKRHYGLRVVGETIDDKKVIYGLDVYKLTSACGFDLEMLLTFLDERNCAVDWLSYVKAATIEGWMMETIIRKISYPITEVLGERYWLEVKHRISIWFIAYMEDQDGNHNNNRNDSQNLLR